MKEYIKSLEKSVILVLVAVLSFWLLNNINVVTNSLKKVIDVLFPFIMGGVLAYIINIPMSKIENIIAKDAKSKTSRSLAIIISLLLIVLILIFVLFLLIPELVDNVKLLIENLPVWIGKSEEFIMKLVEDYPGVQLKIREMFNENLDFNKITPDVFNYTINFVSNTLTGLFTFITSLVFSIYMLFNKENLYKTTKAIINAFFKKETVEKINYVLSLSNKTFTNFISGQCVEACILGFIFFVVLSIFKFPYAILISVLTAITALIPIFGALIACAIGAVLIAINNPLQGVIFVIVFQVIQQIENNFIYPKVVGKSVGLSPMLTLLAITVGGNLFGLLGMLIGLPTASIIHALIMDYISNNSTKKKSLEKIITSL